jgi:hypothetical protein
MIKIVSPERMTDAQKTQSKVASELAARLLDVVDNHSVTIAVNALVRALAHIATEDQPPAGMLLERIQLMVDLLRADTVEHWTLRGGK